MLSPGLATFHHTNPCGPELVQLSALSAHSRGTGTKESWERKDYQSFLTHSLTSLTFKPKAADVNLPTITLSCSRHCVPVSHHQHSSKSIQFHSFSIKYSISDKKLVRVWSNPSIAHLLYMLLVAGSPLYCAAGRSSMRSHMVTCSPLQHVTRRAGQYASPYGYL